MDPEVKTELPASEPISGEEVIEAKVPSAGSLSQVATVAHLVKRISEDSGGTNSQDELAGTPNCDGLPEPSPLQGGELPPSDSGMISPNEEAGPAGTESVERAPSRNEENGDGGIARAPAVTKVVNMAKLVKRLTQDSMPNIPAVEDADKRDLVGKEGTERNEEGAPDGGEPAEGNAETAKVPSVTALVSAAKLAKQYSNASSVGDSALLSEENVDGTQKETKVDDKEAVAKDGPEDLAPEGESKEKADDSKENGSVAAAVSSEEVQIAEKEVVTPTEDEKANGSKDASERPVDVVEPAAKEAAAKGDAGAGPDVDVAENESKKSSGVCSSCVIL